MLFRVILCYFMLIPAACLILLLFFSDTLHPHPPHHSTHDQATPQNTLDDTSPQVPPISRLEVRTPIANLFGEMRIRIADSTWFPNPRAFPNHCKCPLILLETRVLHLFCCNFCSFLHIHGRALLSRRQLLQWVPPVVVSFYLVLLLAAQYSQLFQAFLAVCHPLTFVKKVGHVETHVSIRCLLKTRSKQNMHNCTYHNLWKPVL